MGITRIFLRRDVGIGVADQPFIAKPAGHELLDVVFSRRHLGPGPPRNRLERPVLDAVELFRRFLVGRDRPLVPHRRKPLDEISRRDDLDARDAHQLNRAGVDPRDVRDGALGRVFHRDAPQTLQQLAEPGLELVAARVALGGAGEMRQRMALDGMNQSARLAGRGNQVVPAACREMPALMVDARQLSGN